MRAPPVRLANEGRRRRCPGSLDRLRVLTDFDFGYRLNESLTLSIGANNAFDIHPPEVIRGNPARLGQDAGGVFRYSEFSPFPYSGAFYYSRITYGF